MEKEGAQSGSLEPQNSSIEIQQVLQRFEQAISAYMQDAQSADVLRPHQLDVFEDLQKFFQEGHTKGYIELPTGTGKTVLFVELSKALLNVDPALPRPKILVVAPTKDLVHQTMGRTGEKGYGRFAPELKVGSYFNDTPASQKTQKYLSNNTVTVTTYQSFSLLNKTSEYRPATDADRQRMAREYHYDASVVDRLGEEALHLMSGVKYVPTDRSLLSQFDIIILDEAHHTFGEETRRIIASLPEDKVVIGFTATPDASEQKRLTQHLPEKIHSLELNEAIWLNLLAPVVPVGIKSGIHVRGSNLYDATGDFIDSRIGYLAEDPERNKLILEAAKVLTQNGIGTVISCIAGGEASHARYLAEQLQSEGVSAAAVHSSISSEKRQEIYRQFERGDIDVLTFIGVLGEGWDSNRAKAMIGARPTRSSIFSKQRMGRITRPGGVAFAIDILDEYEDSNPAITAADVLNEGDKPLGSIVGTVEDTHLIETIISSLESTVTVAPVLESKYKSYEGLLTDLEEINRGSLVGDGDQAREWVLATKVSSAYSGVTEEIFTKIEELRGTSISKKFGRQGSAIRVVYNADQAKEALRKLPMVDIRKYFTDEKGVRRISPEGLMLLFSKRYPELTLQVAKEQLEAIESQLDWIPGRFRSSSEGANYTHYKIVKMYNAGQQTIELINQALKQHFTR